MKVKLYAGNKLIAEYYTKNKAELPLWTVYIAALFLWIACIVMVIFPSCSQDDGIQCQEVGGRSILFGRPNTYYLKIKGVQVEVSEAFVLLPVMGGHILLAIV